MINIVTPPDFISNENPNILIINPSLADKENLNQWLLDLNLSINLYVYENQEPVDWVIKTAAACDLIFCNIDNSGNHFKLVVGHLLSLNKTFYLTNDHSLPYNILNPNKIESMDAFAKKLRGIYGKE